MAKGKAPDPKRRKNTQPHASYLKVANGCKEVGWKAGELFGCYGHRTHAQQPCVFDMTEGAIQCAYCSSGLVPEWRGYVPVWDRDFALRYVLVNEEYYVAVESIPVFDQVVCSRAKNPISPLIVRGETTMTRSLPKGKPYDAPIDMLSICLLLWRNEPLTAWFAKQQHTAEAPKAEAQKAPPERKKSANPLERLAEAERKAKAEDALEEQKVGGIINRLLAPAPNGKHPFKKPV